jgi:hypothetical protein
LGFSGVDVSGFLFEFFFIPGLFLVDLATCEEVLKGLLVFFLILLSLFGARQFFDEENVDDFDEFILNHLVVQNIQYL